MTYFSAPARDIQLTLFKICGCLQKLILKVHDLDRWL
jgi:hypothetical protein